MRWAKASARFLVLGLVLVVYMSDLLGSGVANHLWGSGGQAPSLEDSTPRTPLDALNEVLDGVLGEADKVIDEKVEPLLAEPQVPATYFFDGVEQRVGGFGERAHRTHGMAQTAWHEHVSAARHGSLGYRFSDPTGRKYPLGVGGAFIDDYLFTPRISLKGLQVRLEGNDPGDSQYAPSAFPAGSEAVRLSIFHKFNFAVGADGVRVEVFDSLPAPGQRIAPLAVLPPQPETGGASMSPTTAFDGQAGGDQAFTGQRPSWTRTVFDLSPWDGQEIYLAFHVSVIAPAAGRASYFVNERNFPASLDFFGWRLDTVRVEGPALLHNLRLYSIESPATDENGDRVAPSGPRHDGEYFEARAVVENRGSFSETTQPQLVLTLTKAFQEMTPSPGLCVLQAEAWEMPLEPGANRVARFRCPALNESVTYRFAFSVPLGNDQDTVDNSWSIDVEARRIVRLSVVGEPRVQPLIGETNEPRTLSVTIRNDGNDAEQVALRLVLLRDGEPVTGPNFTIEAPGALRTQDLLPPGESFTPRDPWTFLLGEVGRFEVQVQILARGELVDSWSQGATSRVAIGSLFQANHVDDSGAVGTAIVGDPHFKAQGDVWNTPPDADLFYWSFPDFSGTSLTRPNLTGRPTPDDPHLRRSFAAIEVHLVHSFRPTVAAAFSIPPTIRVALGDDRLQQPERPPRIGILGAATDFAFDQVTRVVSWNASVASRRYAGDLFYSAQWVPERLRFVPADFNVSTPVSRNGLPVFSPGSLASLQVVLYGDNWKVSELKVFGVMADGDRVLLMQTGGTVQSDRGRWEARGVGGTGNLKVGNLPPCPPPLHCSQVVRVGGDAPPASGWKHYSRADPRLVDGFYPLEPDGHAGFWWKGNLLSNVREAGIVSKGDYGMLTSPHVLVDSLSSEPVFAYRSRLNVKEVAFEPSEKSTARVMVRVVDSNEPDLFFPLVPPPRILSFGDRFDSSLTVSTSGGGPISINGLGFEPGATVRFGETPSPSVTFVSPHRLLAMIPHHELGRVTVYVTNPDGQFGSLRESIEYRPGPPSFVAVVPASGSTNGGFEVNIIGSGFIGPVTVSFGFSTSTAQVISDRQLRVTVPPDAGHLGTVQVRVTNADGQQATMPNAFTYVRAPAPTISTVFPSSSTTLGGTSVTIDGSGFAKNARVVFTKATTFPSSFSAASVGFLGPTRIVAVSPTVNTFHAGLYHLVVQNPDGQQAVLARAFRIEKAPAPEIQAVVPAVGTTNGETTVEIRGANFHPGARVRIAGIAFSSLTFVDSQTWLAVTPPRNINIDLNVQVSVANPDDQQDTATFTYVKADKPSVVAVSPTGGSTLGGTPVTVTGTGFAPGALVWFEYAGNPNIVGSVVTSSTTAIATSPAKFGGAGAVNVRVQNPDSQISDINGAATFVYSAAPAPTITSLSPRGGAVEGGTTITITGTGFAPGSIASLGPPTTVVLSPTTLQAKTLPAPNLAPGPVSIRVSNTDGQSSNPIEYTYVLPPPQSHTYETHEIRLGPTVTVIDPRVGSARWDQPAQAANARRTLDLRGHVVQFGFVSEELADLKQNKGWFLGPMGLRGGRFLANDVAVVEADVEAPYEAYVKELGPETEIEVQLTLRNRGVFRQNQLRAEVLFHELAAAPPRVHTFALDLGPEFFLEPQSDATVRVPVEVPKDPGPYILQARVLLQGPFPDEDPANNCLTLSQSGADLPQCLLTGAEDRFFVASKPSLRLARTGPDGPQTGLSILPSAGRADFPRLFLINVLNDGNVPVRDFEIRRTLTRFSGGPATTQTETWRAAESPSPGAEADWTTLDLTPAAEPVRILGGVGRYLLTVQLLLPSEAAGAACHSIVVLAGRTYCELDRARLIAESFATFYADRFDGTGRSLDPTLIRNEIRTEGAGFQLTDRRDHSGRGKSWWFGDPAEGSYPADDTSVLELPKLDLTRAQRAVVSFLFNSSLERAYDGMLMEASLDDGTTWQPLYPEPNPLFDPDFRGYPGFLHASNPLHPSGDPTQPLFGFTGTTQGLLPGDDWIPVEFNLGAIPGFTRETVLDAFFQSGMDPADTATPDPTDASVSRGSSWRLPGEACPRCWSRDNLRIGEPHPVEGSDFWWTGSGIPLNPGGVFEQTLIVPVDLREYDPGSSLKVRLAFAGWGTSPSGMWPAMGTGFPPVARVLVKNDGVVRSADVRPGRNLAGDWTEYEVDLTPVKGVRAEVHFVLRRDLALPLDLSWWGWGIDDARLVEFQEPVSSTRLNERSRSLDESQFETLTNGAGIDCPQTPIPQCLDVGWRRAGPHAPPVAPDSRWILKDRSGPIGTTEKVWSWSCDGQILGAPSLARERLVTPLLDLRRVGGQEAFVEFWSQGALTLDVQALDPAIGDWGAWTPRGFEETGGSLGWTRHRADLSSLIGQQVRASFLVEPGPTCVALADWGVTGVAVTAQTLVGVPVRLRLRAGTDSSVSEGGWGLDELQMVGLLYNDNIAVVLETPSTQREVANDAPVTLKGRVRNLSGQTIPRMFLEVTAAPRTPGATAPRLDAGGDLAHRPDATRSDWIRVGSFPLLPAGTPSQSGAPVDEFPFEVHVTIPPGVAIESQYEVRLQLLTSLGEAATPLLWRDENMGDHQQSLTLVVRPVLDVAVVSDDVTPRLRNEPGPVTLSLTVANRGNTRHGLEATPVLRRVGDPAFANPTPLPVLLAEPEPDGGQVVLTWNWTPPGPGTYAFDALVRPTYSSLPALEPFGHFFIDDPPVYYREDFDGPSVEEWSHAATQRCGLDDDWFPTEEDADSQPRSYRVGVDRQAYAPPNNTRYSAPQDSRLVSPPVDLTRAWDEGPDPADPLDDRPITQPTFNFRFQRRLDPNDGVVLEARAFRQPFTVHFRDPAPFVLEPEGGYDTPMNRVPGACAFAPRALGGRAQAADGAGWETVSIPLGGRSLASKLLGENVEFAFRFNAASGFTGQGFYVDSLTISAFHARFEPAEQHADIVDNASKVYRFKVTNDGDATDTFSIDIVPEMSLLPPDMDVELSTDRVSLDQGESAIIELRLTTPLDRFQRVGPGPVLTLRVTSEQDPNQAGFGRLFIDRYVPRRWPDLTVKLGLAGSAPDDLVAGDPSVVRVTVQNLGLGPSRPTELVVLACPSVGEVPAVLESCRRHLEAGGDPDDILVARRELPPLPSLSELGPAFRDRSRVTMALEWTPARHLRGPHTLVAIADPNGRLTEYGRDDNIAALPIRIQGSQKPDMALVPGSFQVVDAAGLPVKETTAGARLTIRARFENQGPVAAEDVLLRITNQFVLRDQRVPVIPPGGSVEVTANWIALPGNWFVVAEAIVPQVELDATNNRGTWLLAIRQSGLQIEGLPRSLLLAPGERRTLRFELTNTGDAAASVHVQAHAQGALEAEVVPARALLSPREAFTGLLEIAAPADAPAINVPVLVTVAASDPIGPRTTTVIDVRVRASREIHALRPEPIAIGPGLHVTSLLVRNGPSIDEVIEFTHDAPAGWTVQLPQEPLSLPRGASVQIPVGLAIPTDYAPGEYSVEILGDGRTLAVFPVEVRARAAWSIRLVDTERRAAESMARFLLLVANEGNVAQSAELRFDNVTDEVRLSWTPLEGLIGPGESRLVSVEVESQAPETQLGVALARGELVLPAPVLSLRSARFDARILDVEFQPALLQTRPGLPLRVQVRLVPLAGEGVARASLFVDGVLADHRDVPMASTPSSVNLTWLVRPGDHVLTVLVANGADGQGATVMDSRSELLRAIDAAPSPSSGLLAMLVAAVLLIGLRRRRQP